MRCLIPSQMREPPDPHPVQEGEGEAPLQCVQWGSLLTMLLVQV